MTFEPEKINPTEAMATIESMYRRDIERYTDTSTGGVRQELAVDVASCPACGLERSELRAPLFRKECFSYHQCQHCSHVYVSPRVNDGELTRLYREGRCFYQLKEFYLPTAEYRAARLYPPKLDLVEAYTPRGRLLDFGSSTGYFLAAARTRGWTPVGVELNPFGVSWSRERLRLDEVYDSTLDECGFTPRSFDAITLWDVVEHLSDPVEVLRSLAPLLKETGVLVIETSRYDCIETELVGVENTNFVGDMHLMHFTPDSLRALCHRAGLTVERVHSFGLDIHHLVSRARRIGDDSLRIPPSMVEVLQGLVDRAGEGCYIQAVCRVAT